MFDEMDKQLLIIQIDKHYSNSNYNISPLAGFSKSLSNVNLFLFIHRVQDVNPHQSDILIPSL